MKFPVRLGRLRNTRGGMRSTARSGYSTYTPDTPYTGPPPDDPLGVTARESQTVALGVRVPFNGTVSNAPGGAALTYSWDLGEGATEIEGADGLTPSCIYTTPGDKTVTLTVSYTDTNGDRVEACNSVFITVDPCLPLPGKTEPPWITEAKKYIDWEENEDRTIQLVSNYATRLGYSIDPSHDRDGWCAAFAGGILLDSGLTPQYSVTAAHYQNWGKPCRQVHGAIAVFGPGTVPGGHVGFIVETMPGKFDILGGNQSDTICVGNLDWYMRNKTFLGYRWPSECSCPSEASESGETDGQSSE